MIIDKNNKNYVFERNNQVFCLDKSLCRWPQYKKKFRIYWFVNLLINRFFELSQNGFYSIHWVLKSWLFNLSIFRVTDYRFSNVSVERLLLLLYQYYYYTYSLCNLTEPTEWDCKERQIFYRYVTSVFSVLAPTVTL